MSQDLINWLGMGGFALLGWLARELWNAVQELKKDLAKLREELPQSYVTKYDYRDDIHDIKNILTRIDAKIDGKVDK